MQKLARRAALASNQAKRKAKATTKKDRVIQKNYDFRERVAYQRNILDEIRQERENRREDWLRGPLAPRRDVGEQKGLYGALQSHRTSLPKVEEAKRRKYINIVEGDRVCVLRGRDKGQIGKVTRVDKETESVTVNDLNIYDVEYPAFAIQDDGDKRPYRSYSLPYPMDDVCLVVPLENPQTGELKDVLAKHVHGGGPFLEQPYGSSTPKHTRYISKLNVEIPWPEEKTPEPDDHRIDTLRIMVEQKTYVPTIMSYPFPNTVIDELRNKYSKYRTRHDPEYVAKQKEKEANEEWLKSRKLLTPRAERLAKTVENRAKQRELMKTASGNYKLPLETKNFVAQHLASKSPKKKPQANLRRKLTPTRKVKRRPRPLRPWPPAIRVRDFQGTSRDMFRRIRRQ